MTMRLETLQSRDSRLPLGTVSGVSIGVTPSFVAVTAGGFAVSATIFRGFPGADTLDALVRASTLALVLVVSLLAHEFGHVIAARRHGVRIDELDLTPTGADVRLDEEPPTPRAELWIALGGPAAGITLLLVALAIGGVGLDLGLSELAGVLVAPRLDRPGELILWFALWLNLASGVANLLPALPLDGGRVLHAVLWARSHDRVGSLALPTHIGEAVGYALLACGAAELVRVDVAVAAPLLLVGAILVSQARSTLRGNVMLALLDGVPVEDAISDRHRPVPADMHARGAASTYFAGDAPPAVLPTIDAQGCFLGLVHRHAVDAAATAGPLVPVRSLVACPRHDRMLIIRNRASPLASASIAATLARRGVAAVIDEQYRLRGVVTAVSFHRAVEDAARRYGGVA